MSIFFALLFAVFSYTVGYLIGKSDKKCACKFHGSVIEIRPPKDVPQVPNPHEFDRKD